MMMMMMYENREQFEWSRMEWNERRERFRMKGNEMWEKYLWDSAFIKFIYIMYKFYPDWPTMCNLLSLLNSLPPYKINKIVFLLLLQSINVFDFKIKPETNAINKLIKLLQSLYKIYYVSREW